MVLPDNTFAGNVQEVPDGTPAAWLRARIENRSRDATEVRTVIPNGFAAYARVFHPAYTSGDSEAQHFVPWHDVARWSNRVVHPEMQWEAITSPAQPPGQPPPFDVPPDVGRIPRSVRRRLVELLLRHTDAPDICWLCFWEGFADVHALFEHPATIHLPDRSYHLARAPLRAVGFTASPDFRLARFAPSIWWPEDRAWCVATEVDFRWTYVGGSAECIGALLADDEIEALPAELGHRADVYGDVINSSQRL